MAAFEVLALDTATPQIRAPGAADTYTFPRQALFLAGTVGAPGIAQTSDDNTGMWWPAADTLAWSLNGQEFMRANSTGLGIGATPLHKLHVNGAVYSNGATAGVAYWMESGTAIRTGTAGTTTYLDMGTVNVRNGNGGSANAQLNVFGGGYFLNNLHVGGTATRATTVGDKVLNIFNGTAPAGTLTNGISLYSSGGEAYVMDAAGNATLFSPHDSETNEWIFRSKHTPTGKVLRIDVERLLRFVDAHFNLGAVQEFVEA